jgi:peptide/nickel transport system permease protein
VEAVGPKRKREAKESLEDWGYYAVPGLVRLLSSTAGDPATQDNVLYWLRMNSARLPDAVGGEEADPAVRARHREWLKENAEIAKWLWTPGKDGPERRAEVVALWTSWRETNAARWPTGFWDRVKVAVTDTQFATYWGKVLRLDLGVSHIHKKPVLALIAERVPVTMTLDILAIIIIYVLSVPLGIFSAVRPYTRTDRTLTVGLFLLYSLPSFFVGTVLLRALTIGDPFAWFPNSGFTSAEAKNWNTWDQIGDCLWHITLPLVVMTYGGLAGLSRYARAGMLDVIRSDYIRTARAKGLSERSVIFVHAARNGMMPVVTLLGGVLPGMIGGSVLIEYIFNIRGMGMLILEAITNKDYNVVVGVELIVAILTLLGILLSDILYAVMDPRISYS